MVQTHPAGLLGKYYSVRHSYGHYISCAISGVYHLPNQSSNGDDFIELLKYALAKTIDRHPILCYGLIEKTKYLDARFLQLQTINWEDVVEIKNLATEEDGDSKLSKEIGRGHEHFFTDQRQKPAWRIVVLRHESTRPALSSRVDVLYYNSHAIGDGTSGVAFHKTLLQFLKQGSSPQKGTHPKWPYVVPESTYRPIFVEEAFPLPLDSETSTIQSTKKDSSFDPWTAAPPSNDHFRSLALILTIPFINVSHILRYCRHRNITLTGLLHSFITIHLAKRVPSAQGFRAQTPLSMRRFTGISNDEMVNHITSVTHEWSETLLSSIRQSQEMSEEEEEIICKIAAQFQTEVAKELLAIPKTGASTLVEISKIPDLDEFCEKGMKKKRSTTYEVSNVGLVKLSANGEEEGGVDLEKLVFSQCGVVAGAAIGCSGVSIAGGPLCLCVHWQEGILEEMFADELTAFMKRRLLAIE